jgi:hypothetical protein
VTRRALIEVGIFSDGPLSESAPIICILLAIASVVRAPVKVNGICDLQFCRLCADFIGVFYRILASGCRR